jgi:hypothetical protein
MPYELCIQSPVKYPLQANIWILRAIPESNSMNSNSGDYRLSPIHYEYQHVTRRFSDSGHRALASDSKLSNHQHLKVSILHNLCRDLVLVLNIKGKNAIPVTGYRGP